MAAPERASVYEGLLRLPVVERIAQTPAFPEPLVAVGETRPGPADSEALWAGLDTMYRQGARTGVEALEAFVEAYPDSVWVPSLRHNLARHYERLGRYRLALDHWEQAWEATRWGTDPRSRAVADAALTGWTRLLAALGQEEKLATVIGAVQTRQPADGRLRGQLDDVLVRYATLRHRPEGIHKCGLLAIADFAKDTARPALLLKAMMMTKAPAEGFSLSQLATLATQYGLSPQVVVWQTPGTIPVPSVAHLAVGHFVSIMAQEGDRYRVEDPAFRRVLRMTAADLTGELSGFFVVAGGRVPPGCVVVDAAQADQIRGRGAGNGVDDLEDEGGECSPTEQGDTTGCPSGGCLPTATAGGANGSSGSPGANNFWAGPCYDCGTSRDPSPVQRVPYPTNKRWEQNGTVQEPVQGPGMPRWSVSEPYLNVWLTDTPLQYLRADGSAQAFALSYKQRNPRTDDWGWGFGPNWEGDRLSYFERYSGYDYVQMYVPGGGCRSYPDPEYYALADTYEYRTRSRMEFDYDGNGEVTAIRVLWPNGAVSTYGYRYTFWSGYDRYFLSQQADPAGRTTSYSYTLVSSRVHLTTVQDRDGISTAFAYNDAQWPHQVTAITNATYSLGVQLRYDAYGRLTNLVDTAGLSTRFDYDDYNWLTNLVTPYGTTAFQLAGTSTQFSYDPDWAYNRSCLITEPDGTSKHLFVYRDGSTPAADPLGLLLDTWPSDDWPRKAPASGGLPEGWAPTLDGSRWMQYRNSFYWNPHQYANLNATFRASNGDLSLLTAADFPFARLRHWLHRNNLFVYIGQGVSSTLSMERDPSPDGTTDGQTTWYDYEAKPVSGNELLPEWEGSFSPWPSYIARVLPDTNSWGIHFTRNTLGQVTEQVEYWKGTDNFDHFRTNRFVYATNGVDLVVQYGPGEEREAGFAYDANHPHLPVALTNALGEITRFYYDTAGNQHRPLGAAYPSGLASTNLYSGAWLQTTIDSLGTSPLRTNGFTWLNGYVRTHTDPRGLTLTFTRDNLGRLTRADFPDSTYLQYAYTNGAGVMLLDRTASRDRLGNWTYTAYTPLRQVERVIDPLGRVTRYTYCGCGGPESVTRAYGTALAETTSYDYDLAGRLTLQTQPDGTSVTNWFDRPGRLVIVGDAFGSTTNYYDNLSRLWVVENAAGVALEAGYDDHDRVLSQIDANDVTVTNAWDVLGRLTKRVTPATGGTETWGYTTGVSGPTAYTNQVGHVTLYAYDAAGRKTNEVQVGVFTNRFTYRPAGDLATLADGQGNTTTWQYDAEGRVTEKWYQGQATADLLYGYNANGWLASRFTRTGTGASTNGYSTTYAYDAAGNLTNVTYPAGTASITNGFDALGRLTNRLDGLGQSRYTYAVLGNGQRTFAEDGPWASDDVTVTNRFGLRAGLTLAQPTGQFVVTNAWDAGRRWSVVGGTAGTFTYAYPAPAAGNPAWTLPLGVALPGGGYVTNTYDTLARLTRTELRTSGGTVLNAHGYQYNLASQRTLLGRTNSAVASWNGYVSAGYDAAGQLTNAWTYQPNGTPVTAEQWSYGYDAAQNLSRRTNYTTVETFTVNALNQLTAVPDSTPTYDRRGNLTQRYFPSGPQYYWTYTYDAENQLASVATDTYYTAEAYRFKVEFTHDGQGRLRVRKDYTWSAGAWVLGTETRYLYDGMLLVQERNSGNTPTVTYTRGRDLSGSLSGAGGIGGLLARSHGYSGGSWSTHNFYHADGNGNVTALVNSAGTLQASYKYDPYGRYIGGSGSLTSANVMRFSSKPWVGFNGSTTAGLYYYGYRFYDPYLQRWLNRDPFFAELNTAFPFNGALVQANAILASEVTQLYGFSFNNPINTFDTDGLIAPIPIIMAGLAIGNCVIGAYELNEYFKCMKRVREINKQAAEKLPAEQSIEWCRKNRGQECTPLLQDAYGRGLRCGLWGAGRLLLIKIGINPIIGGKVGGG